MAKLAEPARRQQPRGRASESARPRTPAKAGTALGLDAPIQRKLSVGAPGDRFEREADRVADAVARGSPVAPSISTVAAAAAGIGRSEGLVNAKEAPRRRRARRDLDEAENEASTDRGSKLQRNAGFGATTSASPSVEAGVSAARAGGRPLGEPVRSEMDRAFQRDFSAVSVHDDGRAHRLNRELDARAFTVGTHVFFAPGEYRPDTPRGRHLLAHELTHVVQQAGHGPIQSKRIQRAGRDSATSSPTASSTSTASGGGAGGTTSASPGTSWRDPNNAKRGIDLAGSSGKKYLIHELWLPKFGGRIKGAQTIGSVTGGPNGLIPEAGSFLWTGKGLKEGAGQADLWDKAVRADIGPIRARLQASFANAPDLEKDGVRRYWVRLESGRGDQFIVGGTLDEIATHRLIVRPAWTPRGGFALMEVDHWRETQLGGSHDIGNLWLLDREANGKSGRDIKNGVVEKLNGVFADARKAGFFEGENASADVSAFRSWPADAQIEFGRVRSRDYTGQFWDLRQIKAGDHLNRVRALSEKELEKEGIRLDGAGPTRINLFLSESGGFRRVMLVDDTQLRPDPNGPGLRGKGGTFISGFYFERADYRKPDQMTPTRDIATLHGKAFGSRTVAVPGSDGGEKRREAIRDLDVQIPVHSTIVTGYGGYIDRQALNQQLLAKATAQVAGLSPLKITESGLTDDWRLVAEGVVTADNPLFPGFEFVLRAEGDSIYIDAPIPVERLQFDPFRVTEANLQVGYDSDGPFLGGDAAFEIDGVGRGGVSARRLALGGHFEFDLDAFDPARLDVAYESGSWRVAAKLGFRKGVIPGIASGHVDVSVDDRGFSLRGEAKLGGPGIPAGTALTVAYLPGVGVTIGGELPIDTSRIPGVRGAQARVLVTRTPEGEWRVEGAGTADIELPGVTGTLGVAYENGLLTISGNGAVSRPPLTGSLAITATNAPADEAGNPVAGPPLPRFRIYGSGLASVEFGKYITGSVGIGLLPNGEIELVGRIELPPEIPIIEPKVWDRPIAKFPQLRFPIIGLTIPVINKSVGVFGFVGGGLNASVTVGPGVLVGSEVEALYNPDRPEEASITGESRFEMRAGAEVALRIGGGVGAGLGIVEATGEVGIEAGLGLELVGGGDVMVAWTPTTGLEVDAGVFGEARPQFSIGLVAEAKVVVDAFLWSGTLWSDAWDTELGRFGPDMAWKARLPARWSEQNGLDLDIDKLEITRPRIDTKQMAIDIFEAVV